MAKVRSPEEILDLYDLDSVDKRIFQLRISYPGMKDQEIAGIVGLDRSNVNIRQNKQKFKEALSEYYKEPLEKVRALAQKAVRVLQKALDSDDERLRVMVALKILTSDGAIKLHPNMTEPATEIIKIHLTESNETILIGEQEQVQKEVKELKP